MKGVPQAGAADGTDRRCSGTRGRRDLGAGPCLPVGGDQVHPAGAVLQPLHPRDGQAVQVEQQRRIVVQARGFWVIVLRREQR
jgi:hypothetical protein